MSYLNKMVKCEHCKIEVYMWYIYGDEILDHVNNQHSSNKHIRCLFYQHFVRLGYIPMGCENRSPILTRCTREVTNNFPEEAGN